MQVVILGEIGSGKTTLYNQLTKSQEAATYGGRSVTESVFSKTTAYGSQPFRVLDTPGFGVTSNKMAHAAGIVAALIEGPVSRILFVVKYDRIDSMEKAVLPHILPIQRFKSLITLTITHWEPDKFQNDPAENKNLIENKFRNYNINSFIYTSKFDEPERICETIINVLSKNENEILTIQVSELLNRFDLIEIDFYLEKQLEFSKGQVLSRFIRKMQAIKLYIVEWKSMELDLSLYQQKAANELILQKFGLFQYVTPVYNDYCDILHELTLEAKKIAQQCLVEFETNNQQVMFQIEEKSGKDQAYYFQILLKQQILENLHLILDFIQNKIKDIKGHCFNYIRKCKFCQQIWVKVEGCEGKTFCGAKPRLSEPINAFQMKWEIRWIDDDSIQVLPERQTFQRNMLLNSFANVNPGNSHFGCGREIEWNEMKFLSEGEIKELLDPGVLDFLTALEEQGLNFVAERKKLLDKFQQAIIQQKRMIQYKNY